METGALTALRAGVEATLSEMLGGAVRVEAEEVLRERERSRVVRCRVVEGPAAAPESVVVKQVWGEAEQPYDPEAAPPDSPAGRFLADWAGVEFLSRVAGEPPVGPRFYGGDRAGGFFILEDLGAGESLAEVLLGDDPARAEQALLTLAATLGRMHAASYGREAEHRQVREALGAREPNGGEASPLPYPEFREGCEVLGLALSPTAEADLEGVAAAMREPGPFRAYVHGDPCPDNNRFYADGSLRLFDFERGRFRHALIDGVYGRAPFPTCWCVNRLPSAIPPRMEAAYRAELVKGCPAAGDEGRFAAAVVDATAHWACVTVAWHLKEALAEDHDWGEATIRQRLVLRLETLAALTEERGCREALGALAGALAARLRARWPPEAGAMPLYPAFRVG